MRSIRRFLANAVAGLAALPVMRGSAVAEPHEPTAIAGERDLLEKALEGADHFMAVRPEFLAAYTGPKTLIDDQIAFNSKATKWRNFALGGSGETEKFILERTR